MEQRLIGHLFEKPPKSEDFVLPRQQFLGRTDDVFNFSTGFLFVVLGRCGRKGRMVDLAISSPASLLSPPTFSSTLL